ncbi:sensor histidine kinase [Aliiglaciecola lipolytica]|uniref:histidine kinase n=1 Tax=Aliiglaciecola lipolytica E3 TaxID=1127673 RepID=K6XZ13_9ALTE|nr:ATP-binding protein [Aliiglaciecola lipolytica]GAC16876.1 hypothetical protein GLIP_4265 [Aliiglaciecola lipolytica E3]
MTSFSIRKRLVRSLSISLTLVMMVILLATDVAVDTWIHAEFDRAMRTKANLLSTLVEEDFETIEFDFAGEFMPEFEGETDPEYYQLWRDNKIFERSDTLDLFAMKSLPLVELKVGKELINDITLPDGRSGRIIYIHFMPQVDSDDRDVYLAKMKQSGKKQKSMTIAYAMSSEKLNFIAWLIDISFLVAAILVAIMVGFLVKRTVNKGFKPLEEFTQNIKQVSLANKETELSLSVEIEELVPIQHSINSFIVENRALYIKEQRLTSDIAHELKTPIAELINLTEVSIKFPNDPTLNSSYKPEVLEISKRLQAVVDNILMFHRYTNEHFEKHDVFNVEQVIRRMVEKSNRDIEIIIDDGLEPVNCNLFAFESIFQNLINNAQSYSPENSKITIRLSLYANNELQISISNQCEPVLSQSDLDYIFDPLWQKDCARTSTENYGLGLAIVKTFCNALGGKITARVTDDEVTFMVTIPV